MYCGRYRLRHLQQYLRVDCCCCVNPFYYIIVIRPHPFWGAVFLYTKQGHVLTSARPRGFLSWISPYFFVFVSKKMKKKFWRFIYKRYLCTRLLKNGALRQRFKVVCKVILEHLKPDRETVQEAAERSSVPSGRDKLSVIPSGMRRFHVFRSVLVRTDKSERVPFGKREATYILQWRV